jgi:hypothetical protein
MVLMGLAILGHAWGDEKTYKGPTAPFAQPVGPTAVKVLQKREIDTAPEFTVGATQNIGDVVLANSKLYMCVATNSTGTSGTNTPSWASGEGSDGTNTWRCFKSGPRKGWVLTNVGTNTVRLGYGYVPTNTTWCLLAPGDGVNPGGTWYEDSETKQDAVYAIGVGTATNGLITGLEL